MEILTQIDTYALYALSIIGGLTVTVRGLKELAKLTPTDKDDKALAVVGSFLRMLADLLRKITVDQDPKEEQ